MEKRSSEALTSVCLSETPGGRLLIVIISNHIRHERKKRRRQPAGFFFQSQNSANKMASNPNLKNLPINSNPESIFGGVSSIDVDGAHFNIIKWLQCPAWGSQKTCFLFFDYICRYDVKFFLLQNVISCLRKASR
jgi:hypothetical protein